MFVKLWPSGLLLPIFRLIGISEDVQHQMLQGPPTTTNSVCSTPTHTTVALYREAKQ